MQVGINVTCMYTSFSGRGLSGFGDMATFQKRPNFPFGAWTKKPLKKEECRVAAIKTNTNKAV